MRNHIRDRVARFWHGGDVIFAKEGRQCGCNSALGNSVDSSAFAESGCIRTEEGYSNIFRVRNFWPWPIHLCGAFPRPWSGKKMRVVLA